METGFSGLRKELSHSNHNKYQNAGERSPAAQWHLLWKKFDTAYLLHYVPSALGWEGSEQLILIYLWNKVCRKTGFHKAQTIPFETPQTEVHCQIRGRILGEPRGLATLEVAVSSATGQMSPKSGNTGNWGKLLNWISKKEKQFSYKRGTLQQAPVWPKAIVFLRTCRAQRCSLQSKYFSTLIQWTSFWTYGFGWKKAPFADASPDLTTE